MKVNIILLNVTNSPENAALINEISKDTRLKEGTFIRNAMYVPENRACHFSTVNVIPVDCVAWLGQTCVFANEYGTTILDQFINKIVENWNSMNDNILKEEISFIFPEASAKLLNHYFSKWKNCTGDFGRFYLGTDEKMRRSIFDYYFIPLGADRYSSQTELAQAIIHNVDVWNRFPYESHIVHQFYLMANNNSLELLDTFLPGVYIRCKEQQINTYGNGINWSKVWKILTQPEKIQLIDFLLENKF